MNLRKIIVFSCLLSLLSFTKSEAKVRQKSFDATAQMTAGQLFLNQVDTVCLYLSTQNIVYVPHLTKDKDLDVDLVFLQGSYAADKERLKDFATRHIKAFQKALKERLEFYTPQIADEFDLNNDLAFIIKVGGEKKTYAQFKEGNWTWTKGEELTSRGEPLPTPAEEESKAECKENCPALVGKKPAQPVVQQPSPPQPSQTQSSSNSSPAVPFGENSQIKSL